MSSERKLFGTDGIRGRANVPPMTPDMAVKLGRAATRVLIGETSAAQPARVMVVKDTRSSCDMLEAALGAGFASMGIDVVRAGVAPSPAGAVLTRNHGAAAGAAISASHNPYTDNGIKFFGSDGYKLDDAREAEIEACLAAEDGANPADGAPARCGRFIERPELVQDYVDFAVASIPGLDLAGMRVVLDAANGAAFKTSPEILERLGARCEVIHAGPDGFNINRDCGCTHPEVIQRAMREADAHAGISHDGDADRVLLADENGEALDGDELMAIAAADMLERGALAKKTLVATVMSNFGLSALLESLGGKVERTAVGDRYVMEAMRRGGFNLGGEQSGHVIFHDVSTTGDGIVTALQVLAVMRRTGKPLSELKKRLRKFPQAQRNLEVSAKPSVESLAARRTITAVETELAGEGRVLVRYSGTEPKIRVLVEGRDESLIHSQADRIADAIAREIGAREGTGDG